MAESYISDNEFTKPCEYLRLVDIDDGVIAENCIEIVYDSKRFEKYAIKDGDVILSTTDKNFKVVCAGRSVEGTWHLMYQVKFSENALREMRKLDKPTARVIKNWVVKNLVDTIDPRLHGKPLTGNLKGIWRYRVGDYRLFAEIRDNELIIFLFEVAHRREIYK